MKRVGEVEFAKPLERAMLRDSRLSFGARGLFSYLWDMPKDWCANATHLTSQSPAGRDAVLRIMKELETIGALRYEEIRGGDGRLQGSVWVIVSPRLWATKTPLKTIKNTKKPSPPKPLKPRPANNSTEALKSREPAAPKIGKTKDKGLLSEGSSIEEAEAGKAAAAFLDKKPQPESANTCNPDDLVRPFLQNATDLEKWASLREDFDDATLLAAIKKVIKTGKNPYCSAISNLLRPKNRGGASFSDGSVPPAKPPGNLPPQVLAEMKENQRLANLKQKGAM